MIYKSLQFVGTDWQTDRRMNAIQGVLLGLKNICSGYTLWILGDFITDIWTMQTTYKPVSIFWEIFKLENNYQQACDMSNVSSISSIDDCAYYYSSLTAMFCPSILAVLIAFGNLVFQAVRKQKNATIGNGVVVALIGLFYPIFLLLFSINLGYRLIFTGREQLKRENIISNRLNKITFYSPKM